MNLTTASFPSAPRGIIVEHRVIQTLSDWMRSQRSIKQGGKHADPIRAT
jgi:hypothetical protein